MTNGHDLWLISYKNALGKLCHMAIFEQDKSEALRQFHSNCEPTDRMIGETPMSKREDKEWREGL
jgi:hypothetical protein